MVKGIIGHEHYTHQELDKMRDDWAERNNVKPAKGRYCMHRLVGKRCKRPYGASTAEHQCLPPRIDHPSLWNDKDTGKLKYFVSQPYGIGHSDMSETIKFCDSLGIDCWISSYPAWHNPHAVIMIVFEAKQ